MSRFLFISLILIILLLEPFMLCVSFIAHTSIVEYFLTSFILVFLCLYLKKYWGEKRSVKIMPLFFCLFFIFYLVDIFAHGDIVNYVKDLLALLFLIVSFQIFEYYKVWERAKQVWFSFLKIVIVSVITSSLLYNCGLTFLFIHKVVVNYPVAHLPFLGLIHYVNNEGVAYSRPSWYFAEPSYLGFFLGIQVLLLYNYFYKKNKFWFFLFIVAILATNSNTGILTVAASLVFYFFNKKRLVNKYVLVLALPFIINAFSFWDSSQLVMNNSRAQSSSLVDRQLRLGIALNEIESMNIKQLLFGKGKSFINQLDKGVSNAYLQMLLTNGLVFLVVYIILLFMLFRYSCYEFYFVFIALNSTEIAFTSMVFLIGVIMYFNYRYSVQL